MRLRLVRKIIWVQMGLFGWLAISPALVCAQQLTASGQTRPTIGVVLAGGGAKGAAHVGVLQQLEAMHIPIDIVTGTSMGSYVGGLYATGKNAQQIEDLLNRIDWNSGYQDRVSRSERRVRDKTYDDRYQIHADIGFSASGIKMPKGVVQGQNMLHILRDSSGDLPTFSSFDQLPIPYRAVATDIEKLEPVVMEHGQLVDAMMASMSVPGALPPYKVDGRLLVDGGITNNMPVDLARQMGADVVIAVDISTDYKQGDELNNYFAVADQLSNYLVRRSTQQQIDNMQPQDVLLKPNVDGIGTTNFSQMPRALQQGVKAAQEAEPQLAQYSISATDYQAYRHQVEQKQLQVRALAEHLPRQIQINNDSHYNQNLLLSRLELEKGQVYTNQQIEQKVHSLYALDRFEKIAYHYENIDGDDVLVLDVKEKEWGPNYLDFRFFLEDDFTTSSKYSLGLTANFTDLSDDGAELRTNAEIGSDKYLGIELFTPITSNQVVFFSIAGEYSNKNSNLSLPLNSSSSSNPDFSTTLDNTENSFSVNYTQYVSEMALGYQPTLWQELRAGFRYTYGDTSLTNLSSFGRADYTRLGAFLRYTIDTLDSYNFPSQGNYLRAQYLISKDDVTDHPIGAASTESSDNTTEISVKAIMAQSYHRHSLALQLEYSSIDSANASVPIETQDLGGFLNLSGIPRDSLTGRSKAYSNLVYRYKWFENDFGVFESPVYLGASLEYGGVWADGNKRFDADALYRAGSLFTGVDSPIGPIVLAYGLTEQGYNSFYLIIGNSF